MSRRARLAPLIVAVAVAVAVPVAGIGGCSNARSRRADTVLFGDAESGKAAIEDYGCGSCHTVPGVRGADAKVGPPLTDFGERSFIAGQLANTPDNLVRWLMDPDEVEPGTAMPDLDVTEQDAQNITAYLEGL